MNTAVRRGFPGKTSWSGGRCSSIRSPYNKRGRLLHRKLSLSKEASFSETHVSYRRKLSDRNITILAIKIRCKFFGTSDGFSTYKGVRRGVRGELPCPTG